MFHIGGIEMKRLEAKVINEQEISKLLRKENTELQEKIKSINEILKQEILEKQKA